MESMQVQVAHAPTPVMGERMAAPRHTLRSPRGLRLVLGALAALIVVLMLVEKSSVTEALLYPIKKQATYKPGYYTPKKPIRWNGQSHKRKIRVVVVKPFMNHAEGDVIKVWPGHYRLQLLPQGLAKRTFEKATKKKDMGTPKQIQQKMFEERAAKRASNDAKKAIENVGTFIFYKRMRGKDGKQIYGSVTDIQVAEEIVKQCKTPVRVSSLTIPKKIAEIGEYPGSVELTQDITAFINIKVVPEGWTPEVEKEEGEDAEEEESAE